MAGGLSIDRSVPAPGVVELHVRGDVDLGSGKRLERELQALLEAGEPVLVNLSDCTFLDSSGLSALIRASRSATDPGRFAVVCLPSGTVRQVFALTRAHTLMQVHDDREQALAAVAPDG